MLSLFFPGLGQLHAGRVVRGVLIALSVLAIPPLFLLLLLDFPSRPILFAGVILAFVLGLWILADAAVQANRGKLLHQSRLLRILVYVAFAIAFTLGEGGRNFILSSLAAVFTVPSEAMAPALLEGDRFVIDKRPFPSGKPASEDIVVFWTQGVRFIQRVVAGPGSRVEYRRGQGLVDGKATGPPTRLGFDDQTVPTDHYFLVGDNRDASRDNRYWGPVPADQIVGKAVMVLFSIKPDSWMPGWERIGLEID